MARFARKGWSTRGNVNPYIGQEGTKPRDGEGVYGYQPPREPAIRGQSSYLPNDAQYGAYPPH